MSVEEIFNYQHANLSGPVGRGFEVTPSDANDFAYQSRAIYVGVAGDVAVVFADDPDNPLIFPGVPAGSLLPVRASRINSTGTTAGNILALA